MDGAKDPWLHRPHDGDAFRSALRMIRRRAEVPFAFGGQLTDGELRLTEFDGALTSGLRRLLIEPGAGLGGRVIAEGRAAVVQDYASASSITHEYDRPVLAEGISSVVAAPVSVRGRVAGILYASVRGSFALGERAAGTVVEVARQLGGELAVRDEVDRRVKIIVTHEENHRSSPDIDVSEEIRALQSELRRIAQAVESTDVRKQLRAASERLAGLQRPATGARHPSSPSLSPRELDVLAEVALGCSNAEIAQRLSLTPETVKAYLKTATRKLEVHSRAAAVVAARRFRLLA